MSKWSETEIAFLINNYSASGAEFCASHLKRSVSAVLNKAYKLSLTRNLDILYNRPNNIPDDHEYCSLCNKILPDTAFVRKSKLSNKKFKKANNCKQCTYNRTSKWYQTQKLTKPAEYIFKRAKNRAKSRGMEFNIEISDIVIPKLCPVLGIEMKYGNKQYCPSLDRIDNSKGYIKGNIIVISYRANTLKSDGTIDELGKIYNFYSNRGQGEIEYSI